MALVEAASRRLDFEQSRDGFSTGSKQPANVPTDFLTGSGNLMFLNIQTTSEGNSFFVGADVLMFFRIKAQPLHHRLQ